MSSPDSRKIDSIVEIERRIIQAQHLIIYATECGREDIKRTDIENIVEAKRKFNTPGWNKTVETNFYASLSIIAKTIKPVSVETIKSIYHDKYLSVSGVIQVIIFSIANFFTFIFSKFRKGEKDKRKYLKTTFPRITFAQKLTREFAFITVIIIIILLFFQTKYIIGTGLYTEYRTEADQCSLLTDSLKKQNYLAEHQIDSTDIVRYDSIRDEFNLHNVKKSWVGSMLNHWNKPWKLFFGSLFPEQENQTTNVITGDKVDPDYIFRATKYVLNILYAYILPIMYGLLGGACLILRILAKEIREHTLTQDQDIRFYLRLILGALSGLAIGWFFGVEEINNVLSLKALSPLALAFIGGYSVDLLFSLLDNLLRKFTSSNAYTNGH